MHDVACFLYTNSTVEKLVIRCPETFDNLRLVKLTFHVVVKQPPPSVTKSREINIALVSVTVLILNLAMEIRKRTQ